MLNSVLGNSNTLSKTKRLFYKKELVAQRQHLQFQKRRSSDRIPPIPLGQEFIYSFVLFGRVHQCSEDRVGSFPFLRRGGGCFLLSLNAKFKLKQRNIQNILVSVIVISGSFCNFVNVIFSEFQHYLSVIIIFTSILAQNSFFIYLKLIKER